MITFLRNLSIQRKLTLMIMAGSTVTLLLVCAGFVTYEVITFRQSLVRDLSGLAEITGTQSTAILNRNDKAAAEELLRAVSSRKHITAARLYKDGRLFAQFSPQPASNEALLSPEKPGFRFEPNRLVLFHEIKQAGQPIGTVGDSGYSFGPQLHFEVRVDGQQVDPLEYLKGKGADLPKPPSK